MHNKHANYWSSLIFPQNDNIVKALSFSLIWQQAADAYKRLTGEELHRVNDSGSENSILAKSWCEPHENLRFRYLVRARWSISLGLSFSNLTSMCFKLQDRDHREIFWATPRYHQLWLPGPAKRSRPLRSLHVFLNFKAKEITQMILASRPVLLRTVFPEICQSKIGVVSLYMSKWHVISGQDVVRYCENV